MSQLKDIRAAIKAILVAEEIFTTDQIIIDRQADEWSVIEQAVAMAKDGIALHIAEATGSNTDPEDGDLQLAVELVLTLFCEPAYTPEDGGNPWPEEDAWERMVKALHGKILLPEMGAGHCYEKLKMMSWNHVPNDFQYYARATTFRAAMTMVI